MTPIQWYEELRIKRATLKDLAIDDNLVKEVKLCLLKCCENYTWMIKKSENCVPNDRNTIKNYDF